MAFLIVSNYNCKARFFLSSDCSSNDKQLKHILASVDDGCGEKKEDGDEGIYICICGRFTVLCVFHCVRLCVHVCHCDSCVFAVLFLDFIHIAVTFL